MKVRIISCSKSSYWYIHLIGEVFEVSEEILTEDSIGDYLYEDEQGDFKWIKRHDAVVVLGVNNNIPHPVYLEAIKKIRNETSN